MVFERQSRQKSVGARPRNAPPTEAGAPAAEGATTGASSTGTTAGATPAALPQQAQTSSQSQSQPQQLPPKPLLAGNTVTNKGLATASLGLRSLLGSARASSIFLDNDSLILPSEHEEDDDDDDEDYEDDGSSLNLSLHTMGGGYGTSSAASIGGSSVLTVANTVTEDPTSMFASSSSSSAQMIAAELNGVGGDYVNMMKTASPQQQQQQVASTTTTTAQNKSAPSNGVRSWMAKTATITRSINSNNNINSPSGSMMKSPMNASQAPTPAASGSRPPPPLYNKNQNVVAAATTTPETVAAAASSPPNTPAAAAADDTGLKIVATSSMITLDSTSPASANSKSSTTTPRKNQATTMMILPSGASTTTVTSGLLAPPSPQQAGMDSASNQRNHQDGGDEEDDALPTIAYYSSKQRQQPMSTFCQYGPRWLKFLLIISIVFLLASIALVAVGVSIQYVAVGVANSNSPDGAASSEVSTPVDAVDPTSQETDRDGITSSEPFVPTGEENNNDANADDETTFDLSNAIENSTTTENDDNEEETSPSDNNTMNESSNSTDIPTTNTTFTPTLTLTQAPSGTPSAMPWPNPTSRPSSAPSDLPTNVPTSVPSTFAPTSAPSTTMQPSSLPPALAPPEPHSPTVSDMPSDSPSTNTSELLAFDVVTFYVLAGQWDEGQSEMTRRGQKWLLENLPTQQGNSSNSAATFLVHLGDWNGPVGAEADREYELAAAVADDDIMPPTLVCSESEYTETHLDFSTSSVPVYFTLGSREFGDCPDPDSALSSYRTWLQGYDVRYWNDLEWDVWNDGSSGLSENWVFSYNDIVFTAINLARGSGASSRDAASPFTDYQDWEARYEATLDWINMNYYDLRRSNRVFVIFVNSGPEDEANRDFYQELLSRIEFRWIRMQFVIVHRNSPSEWETEAYSRRYGGIRNLDVISVQAAVWPPMKVDIDLSNIIRADVSVEQSTWFDEYVEELESL